MWSSSYSDPNPHQIDISVGVSGVSKVYTLINSDWGQDVSKGSFAAIEFYGSDGAFFGKDLYGNVDIRDWKSGNWTNSINGTTTTNVFQSSGGQFRLDMQTIDLPDDFLSQTLETIRVIDTGGQTFQRIFLAGITVECVAPAEVPEYSVVIGLKMVAGGAKIFNDLISLRAGSRAEFRATVTDEEGDPVEVPMTWRTLGEAGTITPATQFTASEQAGDRGSIIAQTEDGFSDTLSVNIIANMLKRMELLPESVALSVGERMTFKAQGYDVHGNPISVRPFWHVAGDVGTISSITGMFVARKTGVGHVVEFAQAVFGDAETGVEGSAKVVVRAPKQDRGVTFLDLGRCNTIVVERIVADFGVPGNQSLDLFQSGRQIAYHIPPRKKMG